MTARLSPKMKRGRKALRELLALRHNPRPVEGCRHAWQHTSWSQPQRREWRMSWRCRHCGLTYERPASRAETRYAPEDIFEERGRDTNVHYVWHKLCEKVLNRTELRGYDLMCAVERFAKRFPSDIRVVGCDDSVHSTSNLVLVEHQSRRRYMGTTVVYIPQNGGVGDSDTSSGDAGPARYAQFFLYGGHRAELTAALAAITKESTRRHRLERRDQNARAAGLRRVSKRPTNAEIAMGVLGGSVKKPPPPIVRTRKSKRTGP